MDNALQNRISGWDKAVNEKALAAMKLGAGRKQLRRDFEGGAGVVLAEGLSGAEQIALAVDHQTERILTVGGGELVDDAVFP